jgi:hypothetical protein
MSGVRPDFGHAAGHRTSCDCDLAQLALARGVLSVAA